MDFHHSSVNNFDEVVPVSAGMKRKSEERLDAEISRLEEEERKYEERLDAEISRLEEEERKSEERLDAGIRRLERLYYYCEELKDKRNFSFRDYNNNYRCCHTCIKKLLASNTNDAAAPVGLEQQQQRPEADEVPHLPATAATTHALARGRAASCSTARASRRPRCATRAATAATASTRN